MAKKIVLELETKADGTIGTINEAAASMERLAGAEKKVADGTKDVAEELAKLREQIAQTDVKSEQYKELTEQYKKLGGSLSDLIPKTMNLKQEQRELKQALLAGQEALGTEKYTQLTRRLGEVNDQLKDIAEAAGQNAGPPLENLSRISAGLGDRLQNLDFEGLNQDIRNVAGNIKNFSVGNLINGIKGLGGAFRALGNALLANPVFAIAAAILAIGLAVKAFFDNQREQADKANEAIDRNTERRKEEERLLYAKAEGNTRKLTQIKLDSNKKDLEDTRAKIKNLTDLQRSHIGITKDQEKQLADLRDTYRKQEIDREIIKIEQLNALNQKRIDLESEFSMRNLNERQQAEAQLTAEYKKREQELVALGATQDDLDKLGEVYAGRIKKLRDGFAAADREAAKSAASAAKQKQDDIAAAQKAVTDAVEQNRRALLAQTKTDQQNELDEVALKYKELKDQIGRAHV